MNQPPDCDGATADPEVLWPPTDRLVPVSIGVADPEGGRVAIEVTDITQDERVGEETCDAVETTDGRVKLRAERSGRGDGRVYHVAFRAEDEAGGACSGVVEVCVPHDARRKTCGDQGPVYDSCRKPGGHHGHGWDWWWRWWWGRK